MDHEDKLLVVSVLWLGVSLIAAFCLVLTGCATTPRVDPLPMWSEVHSCMSGPNPYSNGIPGGTVYRWVVLPGGGPVEVVQLPHWPDGCKRFDVELDGDVDMRDMWRLLP